MVRCSLADLREAVLAAGFTPGARDLEPLLDLHASEEDPHLLGAVERALRRIAELATPRTIERLAAAPHDDRARLVRLLARLAVELPEAERLATAHLLEERLAESEPRIRRAAALGLGRLGGERSEAQLLAALAVESEPSVRRALVEALGKSGGEKARQAIAAIESQGPVADAVAARASVRLAARTSRGTSSALLLDLRPPEPLPILLHCRPGLEAILAGEAGPKLAPRIAGPGVVRALLDGPLETVRSLRTLLVAGFTLPATPCAGPLGAAIARQLVSREAGRIFDAFTAPGRPIRYRIGWRDGGKRRAAIYECATLAAHARPALVSDPSERDWEVVVTLGGPGGLEPAGEQEPSASATVALELQPRFPDERFSYRAIGSPGGKAVPAASHPTIASALARIGGVKVDDVVWDPFCGSGTELIERALRGPFRRLIGWDVDERALEAARASAAAAGIVLELARRDALSGAPEKISLVLTNPPMGRRVLGGTDLTAFCDKLLVHLAQALPPGGRVAWIAPAGARGIGALPAHCARRAEELGFDVKLRQPVDMGGFASELQLLVKGAVSGTSRPPAARSSNPGSYPSPGTRRRAPSRTRR